MKRLALPMLIVVMALTGCSAAASTLPTPTPTPTPVAATPQQVASVIAQYKTDWQEVVDGAIDCRFTWTLDTSPQGKIKGMSCYLKEQTIGVTSQLVLRDWGKLTIPDSMSTIVGSTSSILQEIAAIDLKAACGTGTVPADTDQCTAAIGSRNKLYVALKSQLAAWSPYL